MAQPHSGNPASSAHSPNRRIGTPSTCRYRPTPGRDGSFIAAALGAALLSLALLAAAPPDLQQIQRAQQADLAAQSAAQAQSLDAAQQAQRLAAQRVDAAARLLATETALAAAGQRVDALAQRRRQAETLLAADSHTLAPLLPLLERLSLFPSETLLALPGSPDDAVRGVLVLGGLARQLRARAAGIAAEREQVLRLQAQLDAAVSGLRGDQQAQHTQAAALDAALAQARAADAAGQLQAEIAARRAATDTARAETVRQAIAALDAAARRQARQAARLAAAAAAAQAAATVTPPAPIPVTAAAPASLAPASLAPASLGRGGWALPAAGRVVRRFGAPGDDGPASGITYQTPPGARIVSPCGGRVEFAAPFRSYGLLLIVACGGDVHVVLSGLQRLDAVTGQAVAAGEPLGIMAPAGGGALYLELRRGGTAVDPAPYLRLAS